MAKPTLAQPFATESSNDETKRPEPQSGMYVRRVISEFVPTPYQRNGSKSYGQLLDDMIADALKNDGQIQSVEINITDQDWNDIRNDNHRR
jgi:hypothetical protein